MLRGIVVGLHIGGIMGWRYYKMKKLGGYAHDFSSEENSAPSEPIGGVRGYNTV